MSAHYGPTGQDLDDVCGTAVLGGDVEVTGSILGALFNDNREARILGCCRIETIMHVSIAGKPHAQGSGACTSVRGC